MDQFVAVAAAHFVALLIPGVDFFLIVRTALSVGRRSAIGVCVGIALANAVFIALAFTGVALTTRPVILGTLQLVGGVFLTYVGLVYLRSRRRLGVAAAGDTTSRTLGGHMALGLASGLFNPKNAVFYVSLASALADQTSQVLALYGLWMFSIVLVWDVFIAVVLGSARALRRFENMLPCISVLAGTVLVLFGVGMLVELVVDIV